MILFRIMQTDSLLRDIEALRGRCRNLSDRMSEVADAVAGGDMVKQEQLAAEMQIILAEFKEIRGRVATLARDRGIEEHDKSDRAGSITELVEILEVLQQRELETEATRFQIEQDAALKVLKDVERLAHVDERDAACLRSCLAAARELLPAIEAARWPEPHPQQKALASGQHPLGALLRLVEKSSELADQEWEMSRDIICKEYGAALAVAACRGKLRLEPPEVGPTPPAIQEEQQPVPEPVEAGANAAVVSETGTELPHTADVSAAAGWPAEAGPLQPPAPALTGEIEPPLEVLHEIRDGENSRAAIEPPARAFPASTNDIAVSELCPSPAPELLGRLCSLVWRLVSRGNLGLAYHAAKYAETSDLCAQRIPKSWLLHAVALGRCVRFPGGELAQALRDDFSRFGPDCFEAGDDEWNHAIRFLATGASLRPAVLAPGAGSSAVLHQLRFAAGLGSLFNYCDAVALFGDRNQPLDPSALKEVKDAAAWQAEVEALRDQVEAWFGRAPLLGFRYAPAGKVWQHWLRKGQLIWNLLRPIRENDDSDLASLESQATRWSDPVALDRQVHSTDRDALGRLKGREITADALIQLRRRTNEAVEFLRVWLDLQRNRPDRARSHVEGEIQTLRGQLRNLQPSVIKDLRQFRKTSNSSIVDLAASICERAIIDIGNLFDPALPMPAFEPKVEHLLHADLLRLTPLRLDEAGQPLWQSPETVLSVLEQFVEGGGITWVEAFKKRSEDRDHRSTLRILEYVQELQPPGIEEVQLQELNKQRIRLLEDCREALRLDAANTRNRIEKALAFGLLNESDRIEMTRLVEVVEQFCDVTLEFGPQHDTLAGVRREIESRRALQLERARQRLASEIDSAHAAYNRICQVLENGDVLTAHEYIDMAREGLELPAPSGEHDSFREFFPERLNRLSEHLERFLETRNVKDLVQHIRNRRSFDALDMAPVSGAEAARAAGALEVWFSAKQSRSVPEAQVRDLLGFVGLQPLHVSPDRTRRGHWLNIRAVPIATREQCPVPRFGSDAKGQYRILCVWERPNEEDLVNEAGDSLAAPVIIFFFGRLTEHRRRNLARLCRERRRTFLVLDEILFFHLCAVAGSRLPVFIECALPFTYTETYVTSAGLVPPEMFYGRKHARESILSPLGSCFIYGGRQLGKTALLRDVERQFHSPDQGRIALWLDLKARGIGYDRPIDDLWVVLEDELIRLSILKRRSQRVQMDKLLGGISEWLSADSRRRFLLLLDEADRFLELDGTKEQGGEFVRAARLKGAMDRTDRRFKVVFAGLHNVQRTTTLANHPLAHYGTPICVGPLLEGGEWREARALIEVPLAKVGYVFESPDLVTRILSQTNYYPSLIQLYCQQLFMHLIAQNPSRPDWRSGPPFVITARDVEDAYHSQDLRKAIRDRFLWTLQLDRRYEVIAYSLGYATVGGTLEESEKTRLALEGFPVSWIQREATSWWQEGFGDSVSEDSFRVLLEEMVGLGVLRSVGNRYTLRSPNVISLMGTVEEIESKLLEHREREAEYTPSVVRPVCSPDESWRLGPLTVQQEFSLKSRKSRVSLILGCKAAGLDDVPRRLEELFRETPRPTEIILDRAAFRRLVNDRCNKGGGAANHAITVLPTCPWTEEWVIDAVEALKSPRLAEDAQIIFIADPALVWALLKANKTILRELEDRGVGLLSLVPWHEEALRRWMDDCGFPLGQDDRKQVQDRTGNWPLFLYRFFDLVRGDLTHWRDYLDKLHPEVEQDQLAAARQAFGLFAPPDRVIACISAVGSVSERGILELLGGAVLAEDVERALEWGRRLNLIRYASQDCWVADPLVQKVAQGLAG